MKLNAMYVCMYVCKNLHYNISSITPHTCHVSHPSHPPWLIILIISGKEYKSWSSSVCNVFLSPVTASALCTLCFSILSLFYSFNVTHQVSHLHKTTAKLYFYIYFNFYILRQEKGRQKILQWLVAGILWI